MSAFTSHAHATSDTFSNLTLLNPGNAPYSEYTMSESGIAWPGEAKKYVAQPDYQLSEIVPPPNWAARYPEGYTNQSLPPNLMENEHFQNWMRTAGLPTFTKLYSRNDQVKLLKGRYQIVVDMSTSWAIRPSDCSTHVRYRLPREILQGYEIRCHLNGLLDWGKEPFPRLGVRCRCCRFCALGRAGDHQASCSAEVCFSDNIPLDHPAHDFRVTGAWETCRCYRGTDERARTSTFSVSDPISLCTMLVRDYMAPFSRR
jgi:hypothetical protein